MVHMRILTVEDEATLQEALVDLLTGEGHTVTAVGDGPGAVEQALSGTFDLVLLDLMLPGLDGLEVCRRIRERKPDLAILMLTARGAESDKVKGLKLGADDYVTKPFGARELLARIEALGRRAIQTAPEMLEADECTIDLGRCLATRDGTTVTLTAREVKILRWLHAHRARAVSRAELLEQVWGAPGNLQTRTVDMTIANLRQKIERDAAQPCIVTTVKGVGYAWGTS
jgi:two-component system response regulator RegX3